MDASEIKVDENGDPSTVGDRDGGGGGAGKSSKKMEEEEEEEEEERETERLSSDTVKKVTASLEYEFATRGGLFKVTTVFQKTYVLDTVSFTVSELQHAMKMGDTAFEPKGTHTSYGTTDLLKLVEALCLKSLLL